MCIPLKTTGVNAAFEATGPATPRRTMSLIKSLTSSRVTSITENLMIERHHRHHRRHRLFAQKLLAS